MVGKDTLIVRYSPSIAPWGSLLLYSISLTFLLFGIAENVLSPWSLLALIAVIPAAIALSALFENATDPRQLKSAIPATIFCCLVFGLLMAFGLIL